MSKSSTVSGGSSPGTALWEFDHGHGAMPWVGATAPDVTALQQIRGIPSRRGAGHVPTFAYSVTVGAHLRLESGLEHDLVRELDRRPDVMWLVAQPAKIRVVREQDKRVWHVPDLLSVANDGQVTVWDVRPTGRRDDAFWEVAEASKEACRALGWAYELFGGMSTVRRTNLMWLTDIDGRCRGIGRRSRKSLRCLMRLIDSNCVLSFRQMVGQGICFQRSGSPFGAD